MAKHTIRELCVGDVVVVNTYESGELVGIVRAINIRSTSGDVVIALAGGGSRTLIGGNNEPVFQHADQRRAREFRRALESVSAR